MSCHTVLLSLSPPQLFLDLFFFSCFSFSRYGFTTAVACPEPYYTDISPTPSPTTIQPSHRPSSRPTSKPTYLHTAMLGALQEINGLSLAQASKDGFKDWFANYTATKAGVDLTDVNVTGVFPASAFMAKGIYHSVHDPSIGYGDPGDQTVVQYSVRSTQISEADLLMRLNGAILSNETTAGTPLFTILLMSSQ